MTKAIIDLVSKIKEQVEKSNEGNEEFDQIREDLERVLELYASNITDSELIQRAWDLVVKLEGIQNGETSGFTYERATTNIVVTSSRIKRTHYAAYMAGKISTYDDIGDKFKCWTHNAAAHGAISLGETIDEILLVEKKRSSSDLLDILRVFRNGAFEDASRFLDLSREFDRESPLTAYNSAKLDILSKDKNLRDEGIQRLCDINSPAQDCHPTEISWHKNNYNMFLGGDRKMKEIILTNDADKIPIIDAILKKNCDDATKISKERGDIWKNQTNKNNIAMTVVSTGVAVTSVPVMVSPELQDMLMQVLSVGSDYLFSFLDTGQPPEQIQIAANIGDGGLAVRELGAVQNLTESTQQMLRATFGDGGLA